METVTAPFTPVEVANISYWQSNASVQPLTCKRRTRETHPGDGRNYGILTVTADGLICEHCDYTQDWVPDFIGHPILSPAEQAKMGPASHS